MGKEQEMKYNQRLRDLEMEEMIDKFQNQPLCHSENIDYTRKFSTKGAFIGCRDPEKLLKLKPNPLETNITDLGEVLKEIGSEPRMAEVDLLKIPIFGDKIDDIAGKFTKRGKTKIIAHLAFEIDVEVEDPKNMSEIGKEVKAKLLDYVVHSPIGIGHNVIDVELYDAELSGE